MDTTLITLHSIVRWLVLLFALLSLITGLRGIGGHRDFTNGDKRTALYFLITCDIQLLLGLALYFLRGYYRNFSSGDMGAVMKNSVSRFWTIELMVGMIIAIIIVHIGYAGTKGNRPHRSKFRRLFWCTLIAVIIILITIPWPFRQPGIGRPWLMAS